MNKKKAIKIATATVMAASAFSAVAPFTTEAAVNVSATVTKATTQMKKAQDTYTAAAAKGQVASASSVQKQVDLAKKYYDDAKKVIAKSGGKNKAAYTKKLTAALPYYNNAKNYIAGVNYASGLKAKADSLQNAVNKKDVNYINKNFSSFSAELAKADKKVKDLVVGATAEKVVIAKYLTPAKKVVTNVNAYLGSVKSVSAIKDIQVAQDAASVTLPKTVEVTLVNGKKAQKAVTWSQTGLDLKKAGTYTLTGVVSGTTLKASVKVVVVAPSVASVSAIDVNKVQVKFNQPVDTTKAVVKLTKGLANYNVSAQWNDAKDTVVLTSVLNKLSASDYTVKIEGLTAEALTANVTVAEEKAASVQVASSSVDTGKEVTVYFNVLNQYGTKYTAVDSNDLTVATTESINDISFGVATAAANSDTNGNLKATFAVNADKEGALVKAGDNFKVTAVYKGLTTSSNVTFVNPVALSQLSFGQVQPLKDTKRISVGDTSLVAPITAVDQYGKAYKLKLSDFANLVSSDKDIVNTKDFSINADGNLVFNAGSKEGTAIVTAILKDGTTAQFSVTVNAKSYAKTVQLSGPTALVAAGEKVSLDMVVTDQFGDVIAPKDVTGLTFNNGFTYNSKTGKLEGTVVAANKAFKETVTRDSDSAELASTTFAVEEAAVANTISSVSFPTAFEVGASKQITVDDVVVKDQYGRDIKATSVTLTEKDAANDNFSLTGTNTVKALVTGTKTYTVTVDGQSSAVKDITLTAVATKDVTSYELKSLGTIYNGGATYGVTPELVGKTTDGKTVVLTDKKVANYTTSNSSVADVVDGKVVGTLAPTAADATTTIKAWDANGNLLGSSVVKVTNVKPVLTTIAAAETLGATVGSIFDAKDQYGVANNEAGTWYFTKADGTSVGSATSGAFTFAADEDDTFTLADGEYSVKFVSSNGETVATTTITVAK